MDLFLGFISLLLSNILGFALPAFLAAWLFSLILPLPFDQTMWLSLGMLLTTRYTIQNVTDIPGVKGLNLIEIVLSIVVASFFLALSGLFGWLLWQIVAVDLTLFELILLFAISLTAGSFFMIRSGTGGLPLWMAMTNVQDEDFEEDYATSPPKRPRQRRRKTGRS